MFATFGLLLTCTPEENNTGDNNGNDGTVHVTGISLDRPTATIKEGESITLVATVTPANADNKNVTWATSSEAVATVDDNGKVTGVKTGSATITATTEDGGKKATCALSVEANLAPSVTVEANHVSAISAVLAGKANLGSTVASDLKVGFQYSKSAGILPSNSTTVEATDADANYNYTASITGLEPTTTYFFRSFVRQNGQDTYGETISFSTKDVTSLLETKEAEEIAAAKATMNAKLDLTDVQYKSLDYGFFWGSSETALNTELKCTEIKDNAISAVLTNLSHKTQYWYKAYIKLDNQSFYGEVKTFTTDVIPVESISIDKTEYIFHTIGDTLTLKATVLPTDATDKSMEWSSDKESVATVDQNGTVKAVGNGTAIITVTTRDQGKTATCVITVAQWITIISLDVSSITMSKGQEQMLTAIILPDNAVNKTLKWTSSDEGVAIVNQTGKVTALSKGPATIKVEANDGSGVVASCAVSVNPWPVGAVNLGLSVYWASCNLCEGGFVNSPEEYGDYYAWGETEPYYSSQNPLSWKDGKTGYGWASYKWCDESSITLTKYNTNSSNGPVDNKTVLEAENDAAHVKLGGSWRMPTYEEWMELMRNCTSTWTTQSGVKGRLVTSKINGNSIFLPAAGYWKGTDLIMYDDPQGFYWSSSLWTDEAIGAWTLYFFSGHFSLDHFGRYYGYSVRPVSE